MEPLSTLSCAHCGKDFTLNSRGKHRKFCSASCRSLSYYHSNERYKGGVVERSCARQKQLRQENDERLNAYKVEKGCAQCGYNANPRALQCNHINPLEKSFTVSTQIGHKPWADILSELVKCEILCANCHAIHSYDNKHSRVRRNPGLDKTGA